MSASPVSCHVGAEESPMLQRAHQEIENLRRDIMRLSEEIQKKDALICNFVTRLPKLSSFMLSDTFNKPTADNVTHHDTAVWDPFSARPPCSTPNPASTWSEVIVRDRHKPTRMSPPEPLQLSNRFDILSTADFPALPVTVPQTSENSVSPPAVRTRVLPSKPSSSSSSSSRRRIVKEAARRARTSDGPQYPSKPTGSSATATATTTATAATTPATRPPPLIPPTTAIIGDSIIRHIRFLSATTHCFPGATVAKIVDKLPALLESLPDTITRIVVHIGANDPRAQSEIQKKDFKDLFNILKGSGKSVFISGPLPTLGLGMERFSRLLSLHSWLHTASLANSLNYIDNFNLFWNRPNFYRLDGLHPNRLGSRVLANNMSYTIQTTRTHM